MLNNQLKISTSIFMLFAISGLTGCSVFNKVGKTARNLTTFGNNGVDEKLIALEDQTDVEKSTYL